MKLDESLIPYKHHQGPFRGSNSYLLEDSALFYGRDLDSYKLKTVVESNRLSVLHAPSGAGKTSLVQAALTPELENSGYRVAMCRPSTTSESALKLAVFNSIIPSPAKEAEALRVLLLNIPDTNLLEIVNREIDKIDQLEFTDSNALIVKMRELTNGWTTIEGLHPSYTTNIAKFVCGVWESSHLIDYLEWLSCVSEYAPPVNVSDQTVAGRSIFQYTLNELACLLEERELNTHYEAIRAEILSDTLSLFDFYDTFLNGALLSSTHNPKSLVVIDQFEEFFTLIGNRNSITDKDKNRDKYKSETKAKFNFFRNIGTLLNRKSTLDASDKARTLPVWILISLRDEFYANLDEFSSYVGVIDRQNSYHLRLIEKKNCKEIFKTPVQLFGWTFSENKLDTIINDLSQDGSLINPGHIQIVGEHIWRRHLTEKNIQGVGVNRGQNILISLDGINVVRILNNHFREFLKTYKNSVDQYDILDILSSLYIYNPETATGTRKINTLDQILSSPIINKEKRFSLILDLIDKHIVRISSQLKTGKLIEITHEYLIQSIMDEREDLEKNDPNWGKITKTLDNLDSARKNDNQATLSQENVESVVLYKDRLEAKTVATWLPELLLRSLLNGSKMEPSESQEILDWLSELTNSIDNLPISAIIASAEDGGRAFNETECTFVFEKIDAYLENEDRHQNKIRKLIDSVIMRGNLEHVSSLSSLLGDTD